MKVRKLKHRRIVTPWIKCHQTKGRRLVMGPLSYWFARSVI